MPKTTYHLTFSHPSWLTDSGLSHLVNTLNEKGIARIVGGAVRNSILGQMVDDVDLAVALEPSEVIACLTEKGIKAIPTGLAYGTITAIYNHKGYEITSLRRDLSSDGRRPLVSFTDDWEEDAMRRDFTMNALYLDLDGTIYDYVGGYSDCLQGKLSFIGTATDRIDEDVLRIFRFFRFAAWYSKTPLDPSGLKACRDRAHLIPTLSVERCWRELSKTLSAPTLAPVWSLMKSSLVLSDLLPEAQHLDLLKKLETLERVSRATPHPLLRLTVLTKVTPTEARAIGIRLKMSREDMTTFQHLSHLLSAASSHQEEQDMLRLYYDHPHLKPETILLLKALEFGEQFLQKNLPKARAWQRPTFPLHGQDVLSLGVPKGPEIGRLLKEVETWWLSQGAVPTYEACLAELRKYL